ncbi:putative transporter [Beauveria bassiana]|nr:putative transporter [Beauveria bassiana]KAH8721369.1 putative transporter [Beauveria bassiana]
MASVGKGELQNVLILETELAGDRSASLTPEKSKALKRKIDLYLMPIMTLCFCFHLMDKLALSYTSILGIREDLHLTDSDYSWANGIYYFGYLAASYPAAVLMVRWPVAKLIAGSLLAWGAIAMLTVTCRDATGLLINRFFLGVAEAPLTAGLTIIVAMWYTREEQPFRQSLWYLGGSIGGLVGSFVGLGVTNIHTIASWKALYLILGGATVVASGVVFLMLPDVPSTAWFLTKQERILAIARVSDNLTGIKSTNFSWPQLREALCDMHTWLLVLNQLALNIPNGGLHPFLNIFLRGTGFTKREVFLLNACQFPIIFFMKLYVGWASTRYKNTRIFWMIVCLCISAFGIILMRQLPPRLKWGRWAGAVLTDMYTANYGLLAALTSGNFAGFTKKSVASALIFAAGCAGNIIGPQLYKGSEAPSYPSGYLAMLICILATIVISVITLFYTLWENKRRDKLPCETEAATSDSTDMMDAIVVNLSDKTDRELPRFRYIY